jgi:hypothetical protein
MIRRSSVKLPHSTDDLVEYTNERRGSQSLLPVLTEESAKIENESVDDLPQEGKSVKMRRKDTPTARIPPQCRCGSPRL